MQTFSVFHFVIHEWDRHSCAEFLRALSSNICLRMCGETHIGHSNSKWY